MYYLLSKWIYLENWVKVQHWVQYSKNFSWSPKNENDSAKDFCGFFTHYFIRKAMLQPLG